MAAAVNTTGESTERPIEVAIVGGGCAGITTAFELSRPELQGRYHVTVYQMGWRLGGKGASGRGPNGRIEEHGLHLWLGFYENAFRLLRECYEELDRPASCPIRSWKDAFDADPYVGVADRTGSGWDTWSALFPAGAGEPGDPLGNNNPFAITGYFVRGVRLVATLLDSIVLRDTGTRGEPLKLDPKDLAGTLQRLLGVGQMLTLTALREAIMLLEMSAESLSRISGADLSRLIGMVAKGLQHQINRVAARDDELRRLWEIADIILACLNGAIRFGLLTHPRGFDAIDDHDWRDWLELNGAARSSVDSAFMRGIYDLVFAYADGDPDKPSLGAGQALRGAVRMFFTYRGSLFWKMRAGMGDVVFAPFYELLKARGVEFRFFHRLDHLHLGESDGDEPQYIRAMDFTVQAETTGGNYAPLVDVKGLPCWPATPNFEQLANREQLAQADLEDPADPTCVRRITLRAAEDFDFVVLATGLGAVPHVAGELIESNTRWRDMVEKVGTVPTQAFQLWMSVPMAELGWPNPPINLSGFITPFDTWADMTHLAEEEDWPTPPASIAYFCSVLPDTGDNRPEVRGAEVRENAIRYLDRDIVHIWPDANGEAGQFRWDVLMDSGAADSGADADSGPKHRFDSQFWTANVHPSDRYVQCLPNTVQFRISPLDNTIDNLTLAGDWTDCSHNAGCVEAAVMSGRLAAHAISGAPALSDIIAYDHP